MRTGGPEARLYSRWPELPDRIRTKGESNVRSIALILLALLPISAALAGITDAKVTGGAVSGTAENGIAIFKGIPFAAAPVGDLRWKSPTPVKPWSGVMKADAFAKACMQAPNTQGNTAPVS